MVLMKCAHVVCLVLLACKTLYLASSHNSAVGPYAVLWCVYAGFMAGISVGNSRCLRFGYLPALALLVLDGPVFFAQSWAIFDGVLTGRDSLAAIPIPLVDAVPTIAPASLVLGIYRRTSQTDGPPAKGIVGWRWLSGGCLVPLGALAVLLTSRECYTETSPDGRLTARATTSSALSMDLNVGHIYVEVVDNYTGRRLFVDDVTDPSAEPTLFHSDSYLQLLDVVWNPDASRFAVVMISDRYVLPRSYLVQSKPILARGSDEYDHGDWSWLEPEIMRRLDSPDPYKRARAQEIPLESLADHLL